MAVLHQSVIMSSSHLPPATPRAVGERLPKPTPRELQWKSSVRKRPRRKLDATRRTGSLTGDCMYWQSYPMAYVDSKSKAKNQLTWLYRKADADGDQAMTLQEFSKVLLRPEAKSALADFGIRLHMGYLIYSFLDRSGRKRLSEGDFVDGLMDLFDDHYGTGVDVDKAKLHDLVAARKSKGTVKPASRLVRRSCPSSGAGAGGGQQLPAVTSRPGTSTF